MEEVKNAIAEARKALTMLEAAVVKWQQQREQEDAWQSLPIDYTMKDIGNTAFQANGHLSDLSDELPEED